MKFLIVGINYFTKWVEVEALATITEKNVQSFIWRYILYRYRIHRVLVSDNGKQFDNNSFREFLLTVGDQKPVLLPPPPPSSQQIG